MRPRSMSVMTEDPLVLVGPGGSPPSRDPAVLRCLAAGQPVRGSTGVCAFFGLLTDGPQARGEDHVQERGLGNRFHLDAGQVGKRVTLGGMSPEALQIGEIALGERQALA